MHLGLSLSSQTWCQGTPGSSPLLSESTSKTDLTIKNKKKQDKNTREEKNMVFCICA
jgi:hypothetical protein